MDAKERPILFSGPMVRASVAGHKTQTRRLVKPQPATWRTEGLAWPTKEGGLVQVGGRIMMERCPYGQTGDRLWVRETWRVSCHLDDWPPRDCIRVDESRQMQYVADGFEPASCYSEWGKTRPGIFMPRHLSRITLEVTGVRVERLQDISEADAIAEGIDGPLCAQFTTRSPASDHLLPAAVHAYAGLWESLNAKRAPWASNPWVWVVEFPAMHVTAR